jgi:hypothetical protein
MRRPLQVSPCPQSSHCRFLSRSRKRRSLRWPRLERRVPNEHIFEGRALAVSAAARKRLKYHRPRVEVVGENAPPGGMSLESLRIAADVPVAEQAKCFGPAPRLGIASRACCSVNGSRLGIRTHVRVSAGRNFRATPPISPTLALFRGGVVAARQVLVLKASLGSIPSPGARYCTFARTAHTRA